MMSLGIDLGGSKIEAQVYDGGFLQRDMRRVATPRDYDGLVAAMADLIGWAKETAGIEVVGVAAAGLVHPETGLTFAANLPVAGRPFPDDLRRVAGLPLTYLNDCQAFAMSEAVFGAGKAHGKVAAVVLGTGVGGGVVLDRKALAGASGLAGEIGHTSAPAAWHAAHGVPVLTCGCGRKGCVETYLAGPGLVRLAQHLLGRDMEAVAIVAGRAGETRKVWQAWCDLGAELLRNLVLMHDPDVIVLGGGLAALPEVADAFGAGLRARTIGGFPMPPVVLAEGGPTAGGRGAAFAAVGEIAQ